MSYQYSYLIGVLFPVLIWCIIFFFKKSVRREMLFLSIFSGFLAPLAELIHLRDWWHPITFTHTLIGIEDILYAFAIAGISVSIYEFVLNKEFKEKKQKNKELGIIIVIGIAIFIITSLLLNSIIGFSMMALTISGIILFIRNDLIKYSLLSGLFLVIISIPAYLIVEQITPGWIINTWQLENFSNIFFLKIPLEEYLWHFMAGSSASLIYKFWKGSKEIKK